MVEVVAEDEGGAGNALMREEMEGDAVLVVGVGGVGEVGGGGGRVAGESWVGRGGLVRLAWRVREKRVVPR